MKEQPKLRVRKAPGPRIAVRLQVGPRWRDLLEDDALEVANRIVDLIELQHQRKRERESEHNSE